MLATLTSYGKPLDTVSHVPVLLLLIIFFWRIHPQDVLPNELRKMDRKRKNDCFRVVG